MNNQLQTVLSTFTTMKIIHAALCGGVLLFGFVTNYLVVDPKFDFSYNQDIMIIIVPILAILALFLSKYVFNNQVEAINRNVILSDKLKKYQIALIISLALNEAIALLSLVWFMLSANYLFLIIVTIILINMVSVRPTVEKITSQLHLSESQKRELV